MCGDDLLQAVGVRSCTARISGWEPSDSLPASASSERTASSTIAIATSSTASVSITGSPQREERATRSVCSHQASVERDERSVESLGKGDVGGVVRAHAVAQLPDPVR